MPASSSCRSPKRRGPSSSASTSSSVQRSPTLSSAAASGDAARRSGTVGKRTSHALLRYVTCNSQVTTGAAGWTSLNDLAGRDRGGRRARRARRWSGSAAAGAAARGVVVGDGRVLTNAHNLRGDEVTVAFADGRRETGAWPAPTPTSTSPSLAVDTGDVAAGRLGARRRAAASARRCSRSPTPAGAACAPRSGFVVVGRPQLPRAARAPHRRRDRAHRAAAARLVRRPAGRRRGPAARPQRACASTAA